MTAKGASGEDHAHLVVDHVPALADQQSLRACRAAREVLTERLSTKRQRTELREGGFLRR